MKIWKTIQSSFLFKNRWINWTIKIVLFLGVGWGLYSHVFSKDNIGELWESFVLQLSIANPLWFILAILLSPVTIVLEAYKWRIAIYKVIQPSLWEMIKCIFAGQTFAIWTPNRLGDLGGRLLFLKTDKRAEIVLATWVSNLGQKVIMHTLGMVGLIYFLSYYYIQTAEMIYGVGFIYALYVFLYWLLYLNVDVAGILFRRLPFLRQYGHIINILAEYSNKELWKVLYYSLLRFIVFCTQYYLFLLFFGIEPPFFEGLIFIFMIYSLQASIPIPPFMGLFLRGELAILVWSYFASNEINMLAATFSLFVLNVMIPALLGFFFILKANLLTSMGIVQEAEDHQ